MSTRKEFTYGGGLAGNFAAVASMLGAFIRGRLSESSVYPPVILVIPITGGSPFLTNS